MNQSAENIRPAGLIVFNVDSLIFVKSLGFFGIASLASASASIEQALDQCHQRRPRPKRWHKKVAR